MSPALPSTNGVHEAADPHAPLPGEACQQYLLRLDPGGDAGHWRQTLLYCHVPPDALASEWRDPLQRVRLSASHLIHKETP